MTGHSMTGGMAGAQRMAVQGEMTAGHGKALPRAVTGAALVAAMLLAGCGNDRDGAGSLVQIAGAARQAVAGIGGDKNTPAQPADTPQAMAARALQANPGPLIMAGLESMGTTQVMALTGQNGAMRTYMTPSEQALILRDGMLVGTKGLGNDLSVAEADNSAALIRARRSGQAQRVMRFISGDGVERPLPVNCNIAPGPKPGTMVEDCTGSGVAFQNSYLVQGGAIPVSRQWVGPALGYVTIQVLRP